MIQHIHTNLITIENIYHLADIHIRNTKRHDEYNEIFNKFYNNILNDKKSNSIIVISGDVIHTKVEISPELIQETSKFLNNCGNLLTTIVIAGNHDANLANNTRLDALTPIIHNLNNKNINYLKHSGVYSIADCIFTVMSVFDKPDKYIKAKQINSTKKKIALFHGPINGATTDIGFLVTDTGHISLDMFDGYDMVLLGDIHKAQTLQEYKEELLEINVNKLDEYLKNGWEIVK